MTIIIMFVLFCLFAILTPCLLVVGFGSWLPWVFGFVVLMIVLSMFAKKGDGK